jgi:hypothetical protein
MSTYGTATYNGTTYTLYGRPGSTLRDELNRLANGGEYPAYTSYKDVDGASVDWANMNWHSTIHAATTSTTTGTYAAGTTGADGGTGVGATITAASNGTGFTVDGHAMALGERVAYLYNTDAKTNGIYIVTSLGSPTSKWVVTRSNDADNGARATEVYKGDWFKIDTGTANAGKTFRIDTAGTGMKGIIKIGTDNISYSQVTGGIDPLPTGANLVGALNYKIDPLRPPTEYKELNAVASELAGITDPANYLEIVTALRLIAS